MERALPRLGHVAALDGIRGLAVGVVVLHHLKVPGIHGGWLGVDLFFALSGFLITQSVLSKRSHLLEFWRRRAWRLGPAMAVLLAAYALWWWLFDVEAADGALRGRWLGAAAGQFLNVHDARSASGPFSDYLGHLWSLSAEVQFYVVWPLLLAGLLTLKAPRVVVVLVPAALLVASSVERTVMAADGVQWNRLYLGPDTRSSALWAGCVVGLLHAWGALRPLRLPLAVLAVPALAGLAWLVAYEPMVFVGRVPFEWGLTAIAACALVLVAAGAAADGGLLRWLLEAPPLEWLGRISYSVYLWHVPLIAEVLRRSPEVTTVTKAAIVIPGSLLVGWLSYVAVEKPLMRGIRGRSPTPVG